MMTTNEVLDLSRGLGRGLNRTSLREQALHVLRNAVTSGDIKPGTHLVETELSAALSISRGTLREALRQLQQEGLVEAGERGRLSVRTLTREDILGMFQVRSALEGLAAAELSARADLPAILPRLQRALDDLQAADGSIRDMVEIDLEFHRVLCASTGNVTLLRTWEALAGSIRMSIMFSGADNALSNMSVARHQMLIDAIATGNPETARRAVIEHMNGAASTLVDTATETDTLSA